MFTVLCPRPMGGPYLIPDLGKQPGAGGEGKATSRPSGFRENTTQNRVQVSAPAASADQPSSSKCE